MTDRVGATAIVTGGARGIGGAIARALAPEVEHVVIADIDDQAGRTLAEQLGNGSFTHADAGDPDALERLVAGLDGLDVLVNNAGIAEREAYPADRSWADSVRMNLVGTMTAIQAALPAMRARGGGAVVNVSSVAGIGLGPHPLPAYAATKAAINKLTASLAPLHRTDNIRVNAICPDFVATEALAARHRELSPAQRRAEGMPERLVPLTEIGRAALDLIRDRRLAGRVLDCPHDGPWRLLDT